VTRTAVREGAAVAVTGRNRERGEALVADGGAASVFRSLAERGAPAISGCHLVLMVCLVV
jgi:hypothetical protein